MKSSIIFLGLVALTLTNVNAANEFKLQDLNQQEFTTYNVADAQQSQLAFVNQEMANAVIENTGEEAGVFNPESVIKTAYVKTTEDVVAEGKLITESKEEIAQPLSITATLDTITEDNQIIEANISNEAYPLDFDKINQIVKVNNSAIITSDLKL